MKVNIIKPFGKYNAGANEVSDARGKYLVRIGVALLPGSEAPIYTEETEGQELPEPSDFENTVDPFVKPEPTTKKATPKKKSTKKAK